MDGSTGFVILAGIVVFAILLLPAFLILKRPSSNHKVKLTLYVFVLIWIARFFVGLFDNLGSGELSAGEAFFDSIIHALQTFSMDEDYTSYTVLGKELLLNGGYPVWSAVYGIVISVLNVCAPILGGALLLDILTNAFPRIKIAMMPYRHKFVFSDINVEAVTLAEDIFRDDNYKKCCKKPGGEDAGKVKWKDWFRSRFRRSDRQAFREKLNGRFRARFRPLIIFTDAYEDEGSESRSELFGRAKALGAICIRTDLKHLSFHKSRTVDYFLMDKDSRGNISALSHLLTPGARGTYLWPEPVRVREGKDEKPDPETVGEEESKKDKKTPSGKGGKEEPKKGEKTQPGKAGEEESKKDKKTQPGKDGKTEPAVRIFFFRQNAMEASMVQHLREKHAEAAEKVIIRMVEDYRNAAVNLMYQVPLFLPLLNEKSGDTENSRRCGRKAGSGSVTRLAEEPEARTRSAGKEEDGQGETRKTRTLAVTILGSGAIAEEVFKAVYWCGQMLDTELIIRVLSKDAVAFRHRLEQEYPEILESCREQSPLLKVYPKGADTCNPPYASLSFVPIRDAGVLTLYPPEILEHTDYYIVALGDDERNIAVSDKLRFHYMRRLTDPDGTHPVIAPAVYDQSMASAVRNEVPGRHEPYLIPFAGLKERFSCKNVFMDDFTSSALSSAGLYSKDEQDRVFKDEYSYWANIVRSVHAPYKVFSIGRLLAVNLDPEAEERFRVDRSIRMDESLIAGEGTVDREVPMSPPGDSGPKAAQPVEAGTPEKIRAEQLVSEEERQRLGWLEHRRWNAFLRSQGFTSPTPEQYETYYHLYGTHKCVALKFHNCLVETEAFSAGKGLPTARQFAEGAYDPAVYDALDLISMSKYEKECRRRGEEASDANVDPGKKDPLQESDYKKYDYYEHDDAFRALLEMG